jgi:multicomponent Na+:H+ antiporter subunit D
MTPLPVVIPLLVSAVLAAIGKLLHRRVLDIVALATSGAVFAICVVLVRESASRVIVYWFGNWQPAAQSHFPVGICFVVDPIGAGLAALVSLLVLAAFTFSWSYFESVRALYHVLMLAFLGSMCGLSLSGDLFNMFVWFELMTAVGVALCGYKSEESQPLQGALNFAVMNTVGAFLSLAGVALVYGFTGTLNMAEAGVTLAQHNPGAGFLPVAFLFVIAGFLVKAAVFPFHFWLADAHAVAPTPVCILFSGVMVELGLYAVARIYWVVFAGDSIPAATIRTVFLVVGCLTALLGALYSFGQRHLKRLLAFSTISHVGVMLLGLAVLDPTALAGTAVYVIGHGLVKASLFIGAGILLHRFGSVDEFDLFGRGHKILPVGFLMVLGAVGLAGLPPFATFFGGRMLEQAARNLHKDWIFVVPMIAAILTAGALLRFSARVFAGWGRRTQETTSRGAPHIEMEPETTGRHRSVPAFMWGPMLALVLLAGAIAIPSTGRAYVLRYAQQFERPDVYRSAVLEGKTEAADSQVYLEPASVTWGEGIILLGMFGVAFAALRPGSLLLRMARPFGGPLARIVRLLRMFQSGRVGDYVAWFAIGMAAYGALLLLLR